MKVNNGPEFLNADEIERAYMSRRRQRIRVFYAHPYIAFERGTNENMNRKIRHFIPKGFDINKHTKQKIKRIEQWLNKYPRKIMDYRTPQEEYERVA